ncbi:glycosyltransferase family 61 protein [Chlorogloeopsis sp. ULAP01]|uniref:glycosyltransferase family 61 protein n=1 Tax=Chlorogloeopsis sp. ULAP01 TaxID=3056483 RepID=UPI0025AAD307|nr:glycosyltransferase family 61 protein [Chlorogloeopsis sp. ULAP01]MDM9379589.1 glycosyltransferase family 61 protein [Chlorogloeopsis sp. ULAP01]
MLKKQLKKIKVLRELNRVLYRMGIKAKLRKPLIDILLKSKRLKELNRRDLIIRADNCYEYHSPETLNLVKAYYLEDTPSNVKEELKPQKDKISSSYVFEINNIYLIGKYTVGLTEQGEFIRETSVPYYSNNVYWHTADSLSLRALTSYYFSKSSKELPVACSLINSWNHNNYYQWMINTLTKLEGIKYYENKTGLKVPLIIHNQPNKWQIESLKYLGYQEEDFIFWRNQKTLVRNLIVPSFRNLYLDENIYSGYTSPQGLTWLAEELKRYVRKNYTSITDVHPYVYVSRRKAVGRRILNESEVAECLQSYNFRSYVLEELNLAEQINLFSQAKFVIAPHGAGLSNIIFSTNSKVIEICGETPPTLNFAGIARTLGFQYGCLTNPNNSNLSKNDGNIQVDIKRLSTMIDMLI